MFGPPGGYGQPPGPGGFGSPGGGMPFTPPPKKNKNALIAAGVGALVVVCGICAVFGYMQDKKNQEVFGALTAACDGRPVAGARAYTPGATGQRVVGAYRSSGSWRISNTRVPSDMVPTGVGDTALVACFGEDQQTTVETCDFYRTRVGVRMPGSSRSYPRVQQSVTVRLVAAATGQQVATGTIMGPVPRSCSGYVGRNPSSSDFRGSTVGSSEFGPWVTATLAGNPAPGVPTGLMPTTDGTGDGTGGK